jgi:hypothetical protein
VTAVRDIYPPRHGRPAPCGPFEGVPDHLRGQLERWLHDMYIDQVTRKYKIKAMERLAALVHIDVQGRLDGRDLFSAILGWCGYDPDRLLDVIHYTLLTVTKAKMSEWKDLELPLVLGGSVWRASCQGSVAAQHPRRRGDLQDDRLPERYEGQPRQDHREPPQHARPVEAIDARQEP